MTPLSFSIEMAFLETKLLSTRKIVLMLTISTVMSTHRDGAVGFFFFLKSSLENIHFLKYEVTLSI